MLFNLSEQMTKTGILNKNKGDTYMQSSAFLDPRVLSYGFSSNEN